MMPLYSAAWSWTMWCSASKLANVYLSEALLDANGRKVASHLVRVLPRSLVHVLGYLLARAGARFLNQLEVSGQFRN